MNDTRKASAAHQATPEAQIAKTNLAPTQESLRRDFLMSSPRATLAFSLLDTLHWLKRQARAAFNSWHWTPSPHPPVHLHRKPAH